MKFYLMMLGSYIGGPYDSVDEAKEGIMNDPGLCEIMGTQRLRDKVHICAEDYDFIMDPQKILRDHYISVNLSFPDEKET